MSLSDDVETAAGDRSTLAPGDAGGERRPGFRAAGLAAAPLVAPVVRRYGGGVVARLKAQWPEIVGAELADSTWPAALRRDGGLRLIVASARALEVQHRAPLLMERINLFLGGAAVSRLALVQGPLPLAPRPRRALPLPTPSEAAALDRRLTGIGDPQLRDALARLGRAVIGSVDR